MTLVEKIKELIKNGCSIEFYSDKRFFVGDVVVSAGNDSSLYAIHIQKGDEHYTHFIYPNEFTDDEVFNAIEYQAKKIEKSFAD